MRETTHAVYSDAARLYIPPTLGDTPIQELTPAHIDALYVSLAKGDPENGWLAIGQHSLHNVHTVLHGSLEQAVRWELLERNSAAGATAPERAQHEARHWTTDTLAAFLDLVDNVCAGDELEEKRTRKNSSTYTHRRRRTRCSGRSGTCRRTRGCVAPRRAGCAGRRWTSSAGI